MTLRRNEWTKRLRRALDEDLASPDPLLSVELARRRALAVSRARRTRAGFGVYAPGFAFTAAAIAVIVIAGLPQTTRNVSNDDKLLFEVARLDEDIELIEDLDFYHWLDANGYAG